MKIYRRPRTWLMVLGMTLLILLVGILYHHTHTGQILPNWKQQLISQNTTLEHAINSNKHNKSLNSMPLQVQYKMNQYHIDHNIPPSQITGWDFVNTLVSKVGVLISVFIAVIAGEIVAGEFSGGTIKALLTRPFKRWQILFSKFIATLTFGVFFSCMTFLASIMVGGILYGFGGAGYEQIYLNGHQTITQVSTVTYTLMNYGFMANEFLITATIAFMISSMFRSSTFAISLSIVTLFVGTEVVRFLQEYSWVKYILFANTNLSQYFIGGSNISGMTLQFSIIMLAIYFIFMQGLSYFIFGKRDISI